MTRRSQVSSSRNVVQEIALAEFRAPWDRSVRGATSASVALLLLIALVGLFTGPRHLLIWRVATLAVPLIVLLAALPFTVRGYVLTERHLMVRRLGWSTVLPLAGLTAITGEPDGLRDSVRVFGNGGLFGICGWFWNRRFGRFRAYATDMGRVVLLRYGDGRGVVVTPDDVQHFIVRARTLARISGSSPTR